MGNRDITVIGPKTTLPKAFMRRRVALYARVSTDRTEQENSLAGVDAIIQPEIAARKSLNMSFSGNKLFSQKIRCKCGSYYGHRTSRHGNTPKYNFSFWRCIDHYKGGYHDKAVREDVLFRTVSNRLEMCFRSQEITEAIMEIIESPNVQNKIAAESIWLEMISGDEPELFYDFGTWRFIIRQITVDNPRSPKVDFIWRSSNQNRNY